MIGFLGFGGIGDVWVETMMDLVGMRVLTVMGLWEMLWRCEWNGDEDWDNGGFERD